MNILKIAYEFPPPWQALTPHVYEVIKSQAARGHKIYLFAGRWSRSGTQEKVENVEIINFLNNPTLPFRAPFQGLMLVTVAPLLLIRYIFWMRKNRHMIDVVHCHGHFALWIYWYRNFLSGRFKRSKELRVPLVVHFHNTVEGRWQRLKEKGQSISFISEKLDWPLARLADRLAVKNADALIFVSEELKNEAIKYYGAAPSKCHVVYTGVNPSMFVSMGSVEKEKIHRDLGLDPADKLILNIGMFVERKNIHLLIACLKWLPPHYHLMLVGKFSDSEYEKRIEKEIFELKLKDRVLWGTFTPYPEVPIFYQGADIFVLPSESEGFPKVVMESLSTGVPVLGSAFKLDEPIRGLYYLDSLDPESIAKNIFGIVESGAGVDREKVISKYSWSSRVNLLDQIFTSVINNKKNQ